MEWKNEVKKAAMDEGHLFMGLKSVEKALKKGEGKLIVISLNCPTPDAVKRHAKLAKVKVVDFEGSSYELGAIARQPFGVSVLMVRK
ncbi:MAG: 50S ribosomal protein L30e [Candidatus Altiarchaeota archaeon]|nr:50S ribosomal protein L30e [Candidatus Altiarchaeota archaeon]